MSFQYLVRKIIKSQWYLVEDHFEKNHNQELDWGGDTENCTERNEADTSGEFGLHHRVDVNVDGLEVFPVRVVDVDNML